MTSPRMHTVRRRLKDSHRVARGRASVEVFEELWRASILAGDLLPDFCRNSPADRRERKRGRIDTNCSEKLETSCF